METPPSIITQATTLTEAMIQWAKDSFEKVPKEVFDQRLQICKQCPSWNQDAFAGLGKCNQCGCAVGKLYLPAARCPLSEPKWVEHKINA